MIHFLAFADFDAVFELAAADHGILIGCGFSVEGNAALLDQSARCALGGAQTAADHEVRQRNALLQTETVAVR